MGKRFKVKIAFLENSKLNRNTIIPEKRKKCPEMGIPLGLTS